MQLISHFGTFLSNPVCSRTTRSVPTRLKYELRGFIYYVRLKVFNQRPVGVTLPQSHLYAMHESADTCQLGGEGAFAVFYSIHVKEGVTMIIHRSEECYN
jgi:hypothetical protein